MPTTKRQPRAPRTTRTPTPQPQPCLRVIEGALSIYRPGDKVYFSLETVEMSGIVAGTFIHDTNGGLYVTVDIHEGILSEQIHRVERAENKEKH